MKKIISLILTLAITATVLTGCGTQESDLLSKTSFPKFSELDIKGNTVTNDIFSNYDATIINFWNNGCGTCIAEMPELEKMYQDYSAKNINLIGVGTDSGEGDEQHATAQNILEKKGVTYTNLSPNPENAFYQDFISKITGYPTTYLVDKGGNIIGSPIIGNVKKQEEALQKRIDKILS